MTLSSIENRIEYDCDGSTKEFSFPYAYYDADHVVVVLVTDATGDEETLVLDTDYSLTVAPAPDGGTITTLATAAYSSDYRLVIYRDVPAKQETDLITGGALPSESVELTFDRIVMMVQQLIEKLGRAALLAIGSQFTGLKIPEPLAGYFLRWNSAGDNLENSEYAVDHADVVENAETVENADTVTNATTVTNADAVTNADTVTNTDTVTNAGTVTNGTTVTEADAVTDATTVTNADAVTDADTVTNADSVTNATTVTNADTVTNSDNTYVVDLSSVGITADADEINSRCEDVPTYVTDDNSSYTTITSTGVQIATLDLGDVTLGDVFFIECDLTFSKGATEGKTNFFINQESGTASIAFPSTSISLGCNDAASTSYNRRLGGMCFVTGSGTLVMQIYGHSFGSTSTIAIGGCDLAATFIKKSG